MTFLAQDALGYNRVREARLSQRLSDSRNANTVTPRGVSMSVRIAHCILEPRYSGAEILVLALVHAQIAAGYSVAVVALRPSDTAFKEEISALGGLGCELFVPSQRLVRHQRLLWIRRAARAFEPGVIFAHSLLPSVYCRLALIGMPGISLATVLHAEDDFHNAKMRLFERIFWRRSAIVVGVSPSSLRNYRRRISQKQKTRLIANGVNLETIRAQIQRRGEARRDIYHASDDDTILLQVGRICPDKQQRFSVEALGALGNKMSLDRIRLVFAGALEFKEYYEQVVATARDLGVENKIEFLGSRKDVGLLLAGADAHLMPSGSEAQSIAAIEALASGIFCIFSRLESFLPYEQFVGVKVLPLHSTSAQFADTMHEAITSSAMSHRYPRELDVFRFENCSRAYLEVANGLAGEGSSD
jgi:L-malate glycosyltransferase